MGAFAYSSENEEWEDIMGFEGPDQTYWTVEYVSEIQSARFGTYGRGIWDFIVDENIDVMLGDLNDNLNDSFEYNVFMPLLEDNIDVECNITAYNLSTPNLSSAPPICCFIQMFISSISIFSSEIFVIIFQLATPILPNTSSQFP